MYIAAAKVPMLMDSEEEPEQGGSGVRRAPISTDDGMEQETAAVTAFSDLEGAYRCLPNDLGEFVREDNAEFVVEKRRWDEEQEARAKKQRAAEEQEMQMVGKDPGAEGRSGGNGVTGGNGDVMVVQEKLTYVHTHAKLSLDVTLSQIGKVDFSKGFQAALRRLIVATRDYYKDRVSAVNPNEKSEPVLESMVAYLLKNGVPTGIVEMCLYEQFSLPGLDNAGQNASVVRNNAEKILEEMKSKKFAEADALKEWHQVYHLYKIHHTIMDTLYVYFSQTYHLYRVAVNCFIGAVGAYKKERYEEALDLFIVAYHVNNKVLKKNLLVGTSRYCYCLTFRIMRFLFPG